MFDNKEAHFGGDYFFEKADFGGKEVVSEVFELGQTNGGLRVRGWVDGTATATSGKTITVKLEAGDDPSGGDFEIIAQNVITAEGTSMNGDIFSYIPDTAKKYMRVKVTPDTGITGKFSVAPEYIPR